MTPRSRATSVRAGQVAQKLGAAWERYVTRTLELARDAGEPLDYEHVATEKTLVGGKLRYVRKAATDFVGGYGNPPRLFRFDAKAFGGDRWSFGYYRPGERREAQWRALTRCAMLGGSAFVLVAHGGFIRIGKRTEFLPQRKWVAELAQLDELLRLGKCSLTPSQLDGHARTFRGWADCFLTT